jgi:hypothetical protein
MTVDRQHLPAQAILAGFETGQLGGDNIGRTVRDDREPVGPAIGRNQRKPGPLMVDPAVEMKRYVRIPGREHGIDSRIRVDNHRMSRGGAQSDRRRQSHKKDNGEDAWEER